MKKLIVLAVLAAFVVPAANAYEIVIPYMVDSAGLIGGGTLPASGYLTFVQLSNLTEDTLSLGVRYTDTNGVACTPADNTFEINPLTSWGFRPVAEDAGGEYTYAEGGPASPLTSVGGEATSYAGGKGGVAIFVLPPTGGEDVTEYAHYYEWPGMTRTLGLEWLELATYPPPEYEKETFGYINYFDDATVRPIVASQLAYNMWDGVAGHPGYLANSISAGGGPAPAEK